MNTLNSLTNLTPDAVDDRDMLRLIAAARTGISFSAFSTFIRNTPFSLADWAACLPISYRTLQRYSEKKENVTLDKSISEKIIDISLLFMRGAETFGDAQRFYTWLSTHNVALGGVVPKDLLDTTFGINMLRDELTRIEHGVLA